MPTKHFSRATGKPVVPTKDIARKMKCTAQSVRNTARRLKIDPAVKLSRVWMFSPEQAAQIETEIERRRL